MLYYTQTPQKTLQTLSTSKHGLTEDDAERRLHEYGRNQINTSRTSIWKIIVEPFANVFMAVLGTAAGLSLWQGELLDASIIGFIMALNAVIFYIQTYTTQRVLRTLERRSQQTVRVLRSGKEQEIDISLLVPGDIIHLSEGEKIPADGQLLDCNQLRVNESQLTGESEPIAKHTATVHSEAALYERTNMLYQGSFIIGGTASVIITATGNNTEFGAIASLVKKDTGASPIQQKIDKLISQIVVAILSISIVAFGLSLARGMDVFEALHFVLALAVSAVPESLPIAISVVLVLGMRRMAAKKALVQTMRSIETIGAVTTIASDKTGTLTQNKLSLATTWQPEASTTDLAVQAHKTVSRSGQSLSDPLDIAIEDFSKKEGLTDTRHKPLTSFAFDQDLAMSGNLWHHGKAYLLYVKGAPEHILKRANLAKKDATAAQKALNELTSKGYRVIAIAHAPIANKLDTLGDIPAKTHLTFDGFVAVADQLRPEAKSAVKAALNAGVSVRMITGDHLETAYFIGKELGMATSRKQVFDARNMDDMTDKELARSLKDVRVFARVIPEQKYRLLTILKRNNITAMTGDGVNDVPALSSAHVGLSMGSGSHIARDAGDIILLDDNFKTIIDALREGRTIIGNVRRMLYYLLSTNLGEVITMVASLIIGLPLPLVPVQILWVNLVTDSFMVIPLGLEPADKNILDKKPVSPKAPILSGHMIARMLLIAISMATLTLGSFAYFLHTHGLEYARTVAFHVLVLTQVANAFCARSDFSSMFVRLKTVSTPFYIGLIATLATHAATMFTPLGAFLHMTSLDTVDLITTSVLALAFPIAVSELHKFYGRRKHIEL